MANMFDERRLSASITVYNIRSGRDRIVYAGVAANGKGILDTNKKSCHKTYPA